MATMKMRPNAKPSGGSYLAGMTKKAHDDVVGATANNFGARLVHDPGN